MLSDRGILQRKGRVLTLDPDTEITMPDNVQALIAARLDTLPMERKALLHDASVAGKVFWSGAVSALSGRDDREVREGLHVLVRKELVRAARNSSMEGQQEFSFWHALVRDVAYGQIPRAARGRKHRAVAEWIEAIAGDRVGDHSEVLVHHYTQALDLAKAVGDVEIQRLVEPTRRFLILAGDRAIDLDPARAGDYFRRALDLLPPGHPQRPPTLIKAGNNAHSAGSLDEGQRLYEEAITEARNAGDGITQGKAMRRLGVLHWWKGEVARENALIVEAVEVLERQPPGPELVDAYVGVANMAGYSGRSQLSLEWSEKALALAQHLDDEKGIVVARGVRGMARCDLGDLGGLEDLRRAVEDGLRLGLGDETLTAHSFLAEKTWWIEGPSPAALTYRDLIQFTERRGRMAAAMHVEGESLRVQFDLGAWDEIEGSARDLMRMGEERGGYPQLEVNVLFNQAQVLLFRGRIDQAAAIQGRLIGLAREIEDLQVLVPALAVAALLEQAQGQTRRAVALIVELDQLTSENHGWRARYLPTAVRVLISAGQVNLAEKFLTGMQVNAARDQHSLLTGRALVTEAKRSIEEACDLFEEAARRWADYGFVLEEGQAHFGVGRCLIALGDREAATEPLRKARAVFTKLQARPLTNEVDNHLERAIAL